MCISQVLLLPEESTAVYRTVVSPLGKRSPGAWLLVTVSGPPRSIKRQFKAIGRVKECCSYRTLTNGKGNGSKSSKLCVLKNKTKWKEPQQISNSKGSRVYRCSSLAFHCVFWGALSHLNCLKTLVLPMLLGSHSLLPAWVVEICICQLREVLHLQNLKGWNDISLQNDCHTQIASITRTTALISYHKLQQRWTLGNCCYWKILREWLRVIILLKFLQCLPSTEQNLDYLQASWIT